VVSESADAACVEACGVQPVLNTRPVYEADRSSALARGEQWLPHVGFMTDPTDRTARHATNSSTARSASYALWCMMITSLMGPVTFKHLQTRASLLTTYIHI